MCDWIYENQPSCHILAVFREIWEDSTVDIYV